LGVDVGATKTLLGAFDSSGSLLAKDKIKTDPGYVDFKIALKTILQGGFKQFDFEAGCFGLPGSLDRQARIGLHFANLAWTNVPVGHDFDTILGAPVWIENDAKLAGLSEAILVLDEYKKVLYLTIGTGIGAGLIINGKIDPNFINIESGQMLLEHDGKIQKWEALASGKAFKERYGKLAADVDDQKIWKAFSHLIALGLNELLATLQPEAVIIGGGVGAHFEKFQPFLEAELKKASNPLVPIPPLLKAQRPEEAVIYGCYEYIKQQTA